MKAYSFVYCISLELFLRMPFVIILKPPFLYLGEASFVLGIKIHQDREKRGFRIITKDILRKSSKEIQYAKL